MVSWQAREISHCQWDIWDYRPAPYHQSPQRRRACGILSLTSDLSCRILLVDESAYYLLPPMAYKPPRRYPRGIGNAFSLHSSSHVSFRTKSMKMAEWARRQDFKRTCLVRRVQPDDTSLAFFYRDFTLASCYYLLENMNIFTPLQQ
jgi:hypothetical protein